MRRLDKGFAEIAGLICNAAQIKSKETGEVLTESNFEWAARDEKPEEPEASIHELAAQLMGKKRG